ncbi:hypothetical protein HDU96_005965 [Phlyctochytrium bullatum]|nr:hypothetical protein HDU96_005965 [Phlyctochytrium bullatum]
MSQCTVIEMSRFLRALEQPQPLLSTVESHHDSKKKGRRKGSAAGPFLGKSGSAPTLRRQGSLPATFGVKTAGGRGRGMPMSSPVKRSAGSKRRGVSLGGKGGRGSARRGSRGAVTDYEDDAEEEDEEEEVGMEEAMESLEQFQTVAAVMKRAKKFVAITGAGISVSAGIPDFRSENGLYNLVKDRYPDLVMKGKDLFDASLFRNPVSTTLFFEFMAELKVLADAATITPTHMFLKDLERQGRLLRWYTQDQTDKENEASDLPPLSSSKASLLRRTPSAGVSPTTFSKPLPTPLKTPTTGGKSSGNGMGVLVQLHGSLDAVVCGLCQTEFPFSPEHHATFSSGLAPACPRCAEHKAERTARGKRSTAVGMLRPNVVLYGEHHQSGNAIAAAAGGDARRRIDVLVVIGTSLKVDGVRKLVKDLAKACKAKGGKVVLVNKTPVGKEWDATFDYLLLGDCDQVVERLMEEWERTEKAGGRKSMPAAATSPTAQAAARKQQAKDLTTPISISLNFSGSKVATVKALTAKDKENVPPPAPSTQVPRKGVATRSLTASLTSVWPQAKAAGAALTGKAKKAMSAAAAIASKAAPSARGKNVAGKSTSPLSKTKQQPGNGTKTVSRKKLNKATAAALAEIGVTRASEVKSRETLDLSTPRPEGPEPSEDAGPSPISNGEPTPQMANNEPTNGSELPPSERPAIRLRIKLNGVPVGSVPTAANAPPATEALATSHPIPPAPVTSASGTVASSVYAHLATHQVPHVVAHPSTGHWTTAQHVWNGAAGPGQSNGMAGSHHNYHAMPHQHQHRQHSMQHYHHHHGLTNHSGLSGAQYDPTLYHGPRYHHHHHHQQQCQHHHHSFPQTVPFVGATGASRAEPRLDRATPAPSQGPPVGQNHATPAREPMHQVHAPSPLKATGLAATSMIVRERGSPRRGHPSPLRPSTTVVMSPGRHFNLTPRSAAAVSTLAAFAAGAPGGTEGTTTNSGFESRAPSMSVPPRTPPRTGVEAATCSSERSTRTGKRGKGHVDFTIESLLRSGGVQRSGGGLSRRGGFVRSASPSPFVRSDGVRSLDGSARKSPTARLAASPSRVSATAASPVTRNAGNTSSSSSAVLLTLDSDSEDEAEEGVPEASSPTRGIRAPSFSPLTSPSKAAWALGRSPFVARPIECETSSTGNESGSSKKRKAEQMLLRREAEEEEEDEEGDEILLEVGRSTFSPKTSPWKSSKSRSVTFLSSPVTKAKTKRLSSVEVASLKKRMATATPERQPRSSPVKEAQTSRASPESDTMIDLNSDSSSHSEDRIVAPPKISTPDGKGRRIGVNEFCFDPLGSISPGQKARGQALQGQKEAEVVNFVSSMEEGSARKRSTVVGSEEAGGGGDSVVAARRRRSAAPSTLASKVLLGRRSCTAQAVSEGRREGAARKPKSVKRSKSLAGAHEVGDVAGNVVRQEQDLPPPTEPTESTLSDVSLESIPAAEQISKPRSDVEQVPAADDVSGNDSQKKKTSRSGSSSDEDDQISAEASQYLSLVMGDGLRLTRAATKTLGLVVPAKAPSAAAALSISHSVNAKKPIQEWLEGAGTKVIDKAAPFDSAGARAAEPNVLTRSRRSSLRGTVASSPVRSKTAFKLPVVTAGSRKKAVPEKAPSSFASAARTKRTNLASGPAKTVAVTAAPAASTGTATPRKSMLNLTKGISGVGILKTGRSSPPRLRSRVTLGRRKIGSSEWSTHEDRILTQEDPGEEEPWQEVPWQEEQEGIRLLHPTKTFMPHHQKQHYSPATQAHDRLRAQRDSGENQMRSRSPGKRIRADDVEGAPRNGSHGADHRHHQHSHQPTSASHYHGRPAPPPIPETASHDDNTSSAESNHSKAATAATAATSFYSAPDSNQEPPPMPMPTPPAAAAATAHKSTTRPSKPPRPAPADDQSAVSKSSRGGGRKKTKDRTASISGRSFSFSGYGAAGSVGTGNRPRRPSSVRSRAFTLKSQLPPHVRTTLHVPRLLFFFSLFIVPYGRFPDAPFLLRNRWVRFALVLVDGYFAAVAESVTRQRTACRRAVTRSIRAPTDAFFGLIQRVRISCDAKSVCDDAAFGPV